MLDPYAQMAQYNGLTLWLLDDAAAHWPAASAPRAPLPADGELLVSDLGGTGLVWGRHGDVWWAVSGRRTAADPRYQQGVVAVKAIAAGGARDLLAARPRDGRPSSAWLLTARSRQARFVARSVSGTVAPSHAPGRLASAERAHPAPRELDDQRARWAARGDDRRAAPRTAHGGGVDDVGRPRPRPRRRRRPVPHGGVRFRVPARDRLARPAARRAGDHPLIQAEPAPSRIPVR